MRLKSRHLQQKIPLPPQYSSTRVETQKCATVKRQPCPKEGLVAVLVFHRSSPGNLDGASMAERNFNVVRGDSSLSYDKYIDRAASNKRRRIARAAKRGILNREMVKGSQTKEAV